MAKITVTSYRRFVIKVSMFLLYSFLLILPLWATETFTLTPTASFTFTASYTPTSTMTVACIAPDVSFGLTGAVTHNSAAGGNSYDSANGIVLDGNGKIVVAGYSRNPAGNDDLAIWRYNRDGTLDTTFNGTGVFTHHNAAGGNGNDRAYTVTVDSNNKILAAGSSRNPSGNPSMAVWRVNNNGTLDTSFNSSGYAVFSNAAGGGNITDVAMGIAVDGNDKILITGSGSNGSNLDMIIWKLNVNGTLDTAFNTTGIVTYAYTGTGNGDDEGAAIKIDGSGRIIIAGTIRRDYNQDMAVWRYNQDGSPDATFNTSGYAIHSNAAGGGGSDVGVAVTTDAAGNILITGYSLASSFNNFDTVIWKFKDDGTLDIAFNSKGFNTHGNAAGGNLQDNGNGIAIDNNGNALITGISKNLAGKNEMVIWRFNNSGLLDTTFNGTGFKRFLGVAGGNEDWGSGITIDSNNVIIAAGGGINASGSSDMAIWGVMDGCTAFNTRTNTPTVTPSVTVTDTLTMTASSTKTPTITLTITLTPTLSPTSQSTPCFLLKWGGNGSSDGMFGAPRGIAIDGGGNIYVADVSNARIQKFTSSGAFITKWGSSGSGDGQFSMPFSIAVDSSGNVYVAEWNNNRVQKFDSDGLFITKWGSGGTGNGQFYQPADVVVDNTGNVYVADNGNDRIQKFSNTGLYISKWGTTGSGNGQFDYLYGLAVDNSGHIYASESNRIQKFDDTGVYLSQWGSSGNGNGQFNVPYGLAVSSGNGNVYVADNLNNRVQVFDSVGNFLTQWGVYGSAEGQFYNPHRIVTDAGGNVYVTDTLNHRVQKFGLCVSSTSTLTITPTITRTYIPSNTYTHTMTDTETLTETESPTLTIMDTFTHTVTETRTANLTLTFTATDTNTQTMSSTLTITVTVSATPSITATLIPGPILTPSPIIELYIYGGIIDGNGLVNFKLDLEAAEMVRISIYNISGEIVYKDSPQMQAGWNEWAWAGINNAGTRVPKGVYILVVNSNGINRKIKFVVK